MLEALKQSEQALVEGEIPVGCVIVYNGKEIVATGYNQTNACLNGTMHAEMIAIDNLIYIQNRDPEILKFCDLYVTCEPCIMCASALARIAIRKVYFGCYNEKFGGNGSILSLHNQPNLAFYSAYEIEGGLMENEAVQLFQRFYSTENKRAPEEKRKRKRIYHDPNTSTADCIIAKTI
jgi:tRNA-specific adenosine deaminase 2